MLPPLLQVFHLTGAQGAARSVETSTWERESKARLHYAVPGERYREAKEEMSQMGEFVPVKIRDKKRKDECVIAVV